jgi:hypothetical protein
MSVNKTVEINGRPEDAAFDDWDGDDWYADRFPDVLTADTTDEDLAGIVWCEADGLNACGDVIDASAVRRVLTARRDALRKG